MTRTFAEVLLFALLAMNAGLLIFIAGVLRKVMNEMDDAAFKQFVPSLVRHSKKSAFMLTVLDVPLLGAIPYFYFYGFGNRWLIGGLAVWLVAGGIGKVIKLPLYKMIETGDVASLGEMRHKLNAANLLQAVLNSVAALLAVVPFVG